MAPTEINLADILNVRRGGDLKLSGLRQLFLAVICSLKSPFNRDSAAFEQRLITVSTLSLYPFC